METSQTAKAMEESFSGNRKELDIIQSKVETACFESSSDSTSPGPPEHLNAGEKDGSVISAITDVASIEGPFLPALITAPECTETISEHSNSLTNHDVPQQVILSENGGDGQPVDKLDSDTPPPSPPPPPLDTNSPEPNEETSILVTNTPVRSNTASAPVPDKAESIPQPPDSTTPKVSDSKSGAASEPEKVNSKTEENFDESSLDEYIRSPEVQNAIVERSPGGRYVRFMEKLGSGASKDVYRAYDTQEGIEVAWNVVNLSGVPKTERNRIVNEVRLLERLHHHNIISFHGSWVNRERQEVNFVTEILSSGTLKSFINKVQVIRWKIAKRWAIQILKGLEYLHSQDPPVIHRDLKCENIFINGTSGDLRIGDLGLSTVHRNGRVLSVLGTPEFMAPDMYEENSYDEKVDVYAFGMCMLEMFTKEIPYSECSNPAQIYKKVSAGEPPEVLSRLQSKHARDFVLLCLGYKDENGKYVRPSVSELLQHPFLEKRPEDDNEVLVLPPLRERTISEQNESSATTPSSKRPGGTMDSTSDVQPSLHAIPPLTGLSAHAENMVPMDRTPPAQRLVPSLASSQQGNDDDEDTFEDMQESEIQMRKVKVLMGRGQELKDEDGDIAKSCAGNSTATLSNEANMTYSASAQRGDQLQIPDRSQANSASLHYLVAAAVIENENPNDRPYADDILKLVVTLPVDGQTQNVQFDFHLVEDDPIQVAKEMVQELGIPEAAVLEISETISGLARSARIRQDKYMARHQASITPIYQQGIPSGAHLPLQNHQAFQQQTSTLKTEIQNEVANFQHPSSIHQPSTIPLHQPESLVHPKDLHIIGETLSQTSSAPCSVPSDAPPIGYVQSAQCVSVIPSPIDTSQGGLIYPQHIGGSSIVQQEVFQYQQQGIQVSHPSLKVPARVEDLTLYKQNESVDQNQNHESAQVVYQSQHTPLVNDARMQTTGPGTVLEFAIPSQQLQVQPHFQPIIAQTGVPDHKTLVSELTQPQQQQSAQKNIENRGSLSDYGLIEGLNSAAFPSAENRASQHEVMNGPSVQTFVPVPESSLSPPPPSTVFASTGIPMSDVSQVSVLSMYSSPQQNAPTLQQTKPLVVSNEKHQVLAENESEFESVPSNSGDLTVPLSTRGLSQSVDSSIGRLPLLNQGDASNLLREISSQSPKVSNRSTSFGSTEGQVVLAENMHDSSRNGSMASSSDEVDTDDELISEELRKLDEDFQRNIQRAKKVFDNRMDNLQRSKVEREAQHLKTLEKHEKERLEFEKRLAMEAEEQNKRIELLQREWDKKRESVALHKRKKHGRNGTHSSLDLSQENTQSEHLRSLSTTSSNFSTSPALTSHKTASETTIIATDIVSTSQARKFSDVNIASMTGGNSAGP